VSDSKSCRHIKVYSGIAKVEIDCPFCERDAVRAELAGVREAYQKEAAAWDETGRVLNARRAELTAELEAANARSDELRKAIVQTDTNWEKKWEAERRGRKESESNWQWEMRARAACLVERDVMMRDLATQTKRAEEAEAKLEKEYARGVNDEAQGWADLGVMRYLATLQAQLEWQVRDHARPVCSCGACGALASVQQQTAIEHRTSSPAIEVRTMPDGSERLFVNGYGCATWRDSTAKEYATEVARVLRVALGTPSPDWRKLCEDLVLSDRFDKYDRLPAYVAAVAALNATKEEK
jgi:hypothetical protein